MLATKSVKAGEKLDVGSYKGFEMFLSYESFSSEFYLELKRDTTLSFPLGQSETGNIQRIDNVLDGLAKKIAEAETQLETLNGQLEDAKSQLGVPFPKEEELQTQLKRLAELDCLPNIDGKGGQEQTAEVPEGETPVAADMVKPDPKKTVVADKKPSVLGRIKQIQAQQAAKSGLSPDKQPKKDKVI